MTDADEPTDPTPADATAEEIRALEVAVAETEARLTRLRDDLAELRRRAAARSSAAPTAAASPLNPEAHISNSQKAALFLSLFSGRGNVHAVRVEGQIGPEGEVLKGYRPEWRAMTAADVARHLKGETVKGTDFVLGSYPMTSRTHCRFLAFDFDEKTWREDAKAVIRAARTEGIPLAPEISRSGEGAHLWLFFTEPVPAATARRLGFALIAKAVAMRSSPKLMSFDRLFPAQDVLKNDTAIGNLIALPLQRGPRLRGASTFTDDELQPLAAPWTYLQGVRRLSAEDVTDALARLERSMGAKPLDVDGLTADAVSPKEPPFSLVIEDFFAYPDRPLRAATPQVELRLGAAIGIRSDALTPELRAALIRMGSFWNTEYLVAKRRMMPTRGQPPRFILADERGGWFTLPRGLLPKVRELFTEHRIAYKIVDERTPGTRVDLAFHGTLRPQQVRAVETIAGHDEGILVAATGFGKTVVASALIAKRKVSTLIVVPSKVLADQWRDRLLVFLGLQKKEVGQLGAQRKRLTERVDIAIDRSLATMEPEKLAAFLAPYGQIIVDECHHAAAGGLIDALNAFRGRFRVGLTATPKRRDAKMPAVKMLLGPVVGRFKGESIGDRRLTVVPTRCFSGYFAGAKSGREAFDEAVRALMTNGLRNDLITRWAEDLLAVNRRTLVLTKRIEHLAILRERLSPLTPHFFVLEASMGAKARKALVADIEALPPETPLILLATGGVAGEGFDLPRLDALLLTFPVKWEGLLEQYVGRLLRPAPGKTDAWVVDFVDRQIPVLFSMWRKRQAGYRKVKFREEDPQGAALSAAGAAGSAAWVQPHPAAPEAAVADIGETFAPDAPDQADLLAAVDAAFTGEPDLGDGPAAWAEAAPDELDPAVCGSLFEDLPDGR